MRDLQTKKGDSLMQSLGNHKGSALIWGMVIMLVIGIVLVASFTFASGYANRSNANNQERQAQITARAALDTVAGAIQDPNSKVGKTLITALDQALKTAAIYNPSNPIGYITLENFVISNSYDTCEMDASYNGSVITLYVKVFYGKKYYNASAILQKRESGGSGAGTFPVSGEDNFLFDYFDALDAATKAGSSIISMDFDVIKPKYIYSVEYSTKVLLDKWLEFKNEKDAFIIVKAQKKAGYTLSLTDVFKAVPDLAEGGDIFILLEPGAILEVTPVLGNTTAKLETFIYGPQATLALHGDLELYGYCAVGKILDRDTKNPSPKQPSYKITYTGPNFGPNNPKNPAYKLNNIVPPGGDVVIGWDIVQYRAK